MDNQGKVVKTISIVIPTLNERDGIIETIRRIPVRYVELMGYKCEIIVVDGGSTDGTREVAGRLGAKVILEPKRGYGRAYKTGFLHATGDIIITLDSDGSYPSEYIPRLAKLLDTGMYDFITTNRFAFMESGAMSFIHKIGNKVLTLIARILFNIDIEDSQSGMWVFRRAVLNSIMPESNDMRFSEEIKIRAFLRVRSIEVPIPYRKRIGKPKLRTLRDGISNLVHLLILWIKLCRDSRRFRR